MPPIERSGFLIIPATRLSTKPYTLRTQMCVIENNSGVMLSRCSILFCRQPLVLSAGRYVPLRQGACAGNRGHTFCCQGRRNHLVPQKGGNDFLVNDSRYNNNLFVKKKEHT